MRWNGGPFSSALRRMSLRQAHIGWGLGSKQPTEMEHSSHECQAKGRAEGRGLVKATGNLNFLNSTFL